MEYDYSKAGKRIQLIKTDDPYTNLKEGDLGTIEYIIKYDTVIEDQIAIQWDNGSRLMLLIGKDEYVILDDEEVNQIA